MTYSITVTGEAVIIHWSGEVTYDNCIVVIEQFCKQHQLAIIDKSLGADRLCWVFEWQSCLYSLQYEHYSDQTWIEPQQLKADLQGIAQFIAPC